MKKTIQTLLFISISIIFTSLTGCKEDKTEASNTIKTTVEKPKFAWENTALPIDKRVDTLIQEMTLKEKFSQMLDVCPPIERLGIPEYNWWNESLHGVARNGRATVFPQAIGLGATFDEDLILRVANAISDEARAKYNEAIKIDNRSRFAGLTFWSPNVNIFRDARWGRGQETYGEDPCGLCETLCCTQWSRRVTP